ncbi:MAG: hypothetical protein KIT31_20760, partial [Deltaproteobacteria bacterium]|nr:hypothetical protein [Deltaproteobacteria bacterium]
AVQRFLDGDRDVAMRRDIAHRELAAAHAALARGNGVAERREAMIAAGRALAFDPQNRDTAALVTRLMLEPPADVPEEVERALVEEDTNTMYETRTTIALGGLGYLLFVPLLWAAGFRTPWFHAATVAMCLPLVGVAVFATRARMLAAGWMAMFMGFGLVALYAHMFGAFLVAPALGVVTAMLLASHPLRLVNSYVLYAIAVAAILAPSLVQLRVAFTGSDIVIHTAADELDPSVMRAVLLAFVLQLVATGVILARTLTAQRRRASRQLQLQAWQLRQLVPPAAGA